MALASRLALESNPHNPYRVELWRMLWDVGWELGQQKLQIRRLAAIAVDHEESLQAVLRQNAELEGAVHAELAVTFGKSVSEALKSLGVDSNGERVNSVATPDRIGRGSH